MTNTVLFLLNQICSKSNRMMGITLLIRRMFGSSIAVHVIHTILCFEQLRLSSCSSRGVAGRDPTTISNLWCDR